VKRTLLALSIAALLVTSSPLLHAEDAAAGKAVAQKETTTAPVPKETAVVTHGSLTINGQDIRYTATAGTLLIRNDKGEPVASMFYVAYTRDGDKNMATRPVTFLYNGGPGSSSIWLHMGAFGPMRVVVGDGASTPPPPYDLVANHHSILDKTDLVFIDAIGTGYSTIVGTGKDKDFWGVDEDVRSFANFIQRYITVNNRWNSPKFLYGESYGTTRSAALAEYLQEHGIALNGVVLQSSILNYGLLMPGQDTKYELYLPTYAAIAWYHNKLPNKPADLTTFLDQVRHFADTDYARALAQGENLPAAEADTIAQKLHEYTGLPVGYIKRANLRIEASNFRKELMLPERESIGRYDGRYAGYNINSISATPDFDPSDAFITPAYTAAFNWYVTNVLKYKSDVPYMVMNDKIIQSWDWKHRAPGAGGWPLPLPYVVGDLGAAMRQNPHLRVFSANGYFDLATPFHATEFDLDHMMLEPALRSHLSFGYYPSGHMIYLNPDALKLLQKDLDTFYDSTLRH